MNSKNSFYQFFSLNYDAFITNNQIQGLNLYYFLSSFEIIGW